MALIEKKKFHFISLSPQLSLTSASLSYQAAMAEVVQAMRDREKETITINTTPQINIPQSHTKNPNPIHSQRPRPKKKKRKKKSIIIKKENEANQSIRFVAVFVNFVEKKQIYIGKREGGGEGGL